MTRPRLNGPTVVAYVQLSLVAFFMTGFGATQALLRDEQDTSKVVGGLHATIFALTGIMAALVTPRLVARFGRSRVLVMGAYAFSGGLAGYLLPLGPGVTLPSVGIISLGAATLIICFSAFLMDHQGSAGPSSLTQANAFAAGASVLAPIAIGLGAAMTLGWRFSLWISLIALVVLALFAHRRMAVIIDKTQHDGHDAIAWRDMPRPMWWSVVLVAVFSAIELTTFMWAADLLRERGGASPALGAGLIAVIALGLVVGRLIGSRLAQTRTIDSLLSFAGIITLIGFAVAWLSPVSLVMTLGFFVVGIGLSLNRPLGFARAVQASGGWATEATSLVSIAGGVAFAIIPLALGALAEIVGIHIAFLMLPVLLIAALIILRFHPEVETRQVARVTTLAVSTSEQSKDLN